MNKLSSHNKMDVSQKHNIEQKNPHAKGYILYDLSVGEEEGVNDRADQQGTRGTGSALFLHLHGGYMMLACPDLLSGTFMFCVLFFLRSAAIEK